MKVLLDTHVLLWRLAADPALADRAGDVIADPGTTAVVSAATVWEIAVKQAAGRLDAPGDLLEVLEVDGLETLAMTAANALEAGRLPPHHADPFDRMLIAQARTEGLALVTVDRRFAEYDVTLLAMH